MLLPFHEKAKHGGSYYWLILLLLGVLSAVKLSDAYMLLLLLCFNELV